MIYNVRGEILGFPDTIKVDIAKVDELFCTMRDVDNKNISFTIINPYMLREYSFDIPLDIKVLLEINKDSKLSVYNILIIQKPLENSTINFLAPIIINHDNDKLAQIILEPSKNLSFGMAETIKSFKENG